MHYCVWNQPRIQRYFVRFLLAPPVFAFCAMGGLLFPLCHPMFVFLRSRYVTHCCCVPRGRAALVSLP